MITHHERTAKYGFIAKEIDRYLGIDMLVKQQQELMDKRRALDAQIAALKKQAVAARKEYDALTEKLNLEHKIGKMTPEQKAEAIKILQS